MADVLQLKVVVAVALVSATTSSEMEAVTEAVRADTVTRMPVMARTILPFPQIAVAAVEVEEEEPVAVYATPFSVVSALVATPAVFHMKTAPPEVMEVDLTLAGAQQVVDAKSAMLSNVESAIVVIVAVLPTK